MANSKYEYVKSYEVEAEVFLPNLIVVRIDGRDFQRFSEVHEFEKPNDEVALNLMNSCAISVSEAFPDIVFSYGFSDEYSFVFKKTSRFYQRRASKVGTIIVSFFTSVYVMKWREFFPHKELMYPPSFHARVIRCASEEVLQSYLLWRQNNCHTNNLHNTCLWELIKSGITESEALDLLKDSSKEEKNDLLFRKCDINYQKLHSMFRQGSCILKTEVFEVVKHNENGSPVKRLRRKSSIVHSKNIADRRFWNEHTHLQKELGSFTKDIGKVEPDYIRSFQFEDKLIPSTWVVIRIDGCHFHRFSEVHEFVKPNDEQAVNLMNSCAVAVLKEFQDLVFSYGVSDEYSFVLKKESQFYQRQASQMVSVIVSFFTSMYVMKWKDFLPRKELKYPPYFDGRAVCYPSYEILRDYLSWRQVDCHINNQYNTCFWELVKSGKRKSEAQNVLKGTQTGDKEKLLKQFGIEYNKLPVMFRHGSSAFWDKEDTTRIHENKEWNGNSGKRVIVEHCNIIEPTFWDAHPTILSGGIKQLIIEENQEILCMNLVAVLKEFQDLVFSYGVSDEYSFVLKKDSQFYQREASEMVSVIVSFFTSVYVMKWKDFFPRKELKYPPCFDGRAVCYPSYEILRDYLSWRQVMVSVIVSFFTSVYVMKWKDFFPRKELKYPPCFDGRAVCYPSYEILRDYLSWRQVDCHINNQYNACFWELVKSGKRKSEA